MRPHPPPAPSVLELVPDPERGTIVPPETAEDDEGGPEGAALLVAGAYGCGCASATVVWLTAFGLLVLLWD